MDECNILVVDDEEAVRLVTTEMLSRLGYAVVAADGGESALLELAQRDFQVVMLDLAMPGMSGVDVYMAMRNRGYPGRVIFMTGYTHDELEGLLDKDPDVAVLSKPFPMQELKDSVASALV